MRHATNPGAIDALRKAAAALILLAGCAADALTAMSTTTDEFTQNDAPPVDVLWVVDNSQSMSEEQTSLGQSFARFLERFSESEVDYHIGVISTDTASGGILHAPGGNPPFITPSTPDPSGTFLENVCFGTIGTGGQCQVSSGASSEKAFAAASLALGKGDTWSPGDEPAPPNPNFLRKNAALFVVMVSDEDDHSFGPVEYYLRLFESYKGAGNEGRVSVSAIAGPAGGCGSAVPGDRYAHLASDSGGVFSSVCEDFADALVTLSHSAAGLRDRYPLSAVPTAGNKIACDDKTVDDICVIVRHASLPGGGGPVPADLVDGWTYDEATNTIIFHGEAVPPPLATVSVTYQEGR